MYVVIMIIRLSKRASEISAKRLRPYSRSGTVNPG